MKKSTRLLWLFLALTLTIVLLTVMDVQSAGGWDAVIKGAWPTGNSVFWNMILIVGAVWFVVGMARIWVWSGEIAKYEK